MKKFLIICTALAVGLFTGCNKNNPEGDGGSAGEMPDVGITAVANPDNTARISATLTAGQFHGAKIVSAVEISTIGDLNYTNEIQLIRYVEENGKDIELPFTETVSDIVYKRDYLSAVIVYDETGRACASAYTTFTGDGEIDGFSGDNSAGNLDENNPVL